MSHVRADRWYKLGRTILYGRLEDEAPFQSVRRLVEYEDYALRLVRDAGIHTAAAYGIVEMTPEREYLLVTEFFDGAKEIGDVEVDDEPHRPGTAAGAPALGRRPGPPRHQAGQPDGPGRRAAAHRRGVRAGATVAVAAGRRPGQHDARPRRPDRQPAGLRPRPAPVHARGDRRGVRRHPRRGQPDAAAGDDEAGRPQPDRRVPGPRPAPAPHLAPALEREACRARGRHPHRRLPGRAGRVRAASSRRRSRAEGAPPAARATA